MRTKILLAATIGCIVLGNVSIFPTVTSAKTKIETNVDLTATSSASTTSNIDVEKKVRAFFAKTPAMIEIARCESKCRQYTDSGSVLRGGYNNSMIGIFQFYETIHLKAAAALGFDLATIEGNLGYAKHLYTVSGTQPWNSSKSCWNIAKTTATPLSKAEKEKLIAKIETLTKLVATLQKLLAEQQRISRSAH